MDIMWSRVSSLSLRHMYQVHHFPAEPSQAIKKHYHIFSPQKPRGARRAKVIIFLIKLREVGLSEMKGLTKVNLGRAIPTARSLPGCHFCEAQLPSLQGSLPQGQVEMPRVPSGGQWVHRPMTGKRGWLQRGSGAGH